MRPARLGAEAVVVRPVVVRPVVVRPVVARCRVRCGRVRVGEDVARRRGPESMAADRPGAAALGGQHPLGDGDLLFAGRLVRGTGELAVVNQVDPKLSYPYAFSVLTLPGRSWFKICRIAIKWRSRSGHAQRCQCGS